MRRGILLAICLASGCADEPMAAPDARLLEATTTLELCERGGEAHQARVVECYPGLTVDGWAADYAAACCSGIDCDVPVWVVVVDGCVRRIGQEPCNDFFQGGYVDVPADCWGTNR